MEVIYFSFLSKKPRSSSYNTAAAKIHVLLPEAKIIIVLRNPTARAFSHYFMDRGLGYVNVSFDDIVR